MTYDCNNSSIASAAFPSLVVLVVEHDVPAVIAVSIINAFLVGDVAVMLQREGHKYDQFLVFATYLLSRRIRDIQTQTFF